MFKRGKRLLLLVALLWGLLLADPLFAQREVSFVTPREFEVGRFPISTAVGDINGDGIEDLAVANSSNVSILLGNGDGTFERVQDIGAGRNPHAITI